MWIILWNPYSSFKAFLGSLPLLIKSIKTEYQRVLYQIGHTSELINKLRTKKKDFEDQTYTLTPEIHCYWYKFKF